MNIRRAIVCVLLLALLLPSCRESGGLHIRTDAGDGASGSAQGGMLTGVYRGAELPLPDGVSVDSMRIGPGGVRVDGETGEVTLWTMDADGRIRLVTTGEDGVKSDTALDIPENSSVVTGAVGETCFVWVTAEYADRRWSGEILNRLDFETGEVKTFDGVRSFFATADEQEAEFGRFNLTSSAVDADGDIWLESAGEILVLSPEFVLKTSFVSRGYYTPLIVSPDGTVWIPENAGFLMLDKNTGRGSALRIWKQPDKGAFSPASGYDFYYETDEGVSGFSGGESTLLMNYQNSGVMPGESNFCGVFDPETFLFAESDGRLMKYASVGDIDISTLPTIEIAVNGAGALMMEYSMGIVNYNRTHPETRLIVTDYTGYNTDENPFAGGQKLAIDLVTGVIHPDIVIAKLRSSYEPDAGMEVEAMLKHGLYTDLTEYMERDPVLNPDNLFGAVRRTFTAEDGGIWGITSGFQVSTLFGPTALLEKWADGNGSSRGWTLREMLDFADSIPSGSWLIGGLNRQTAEQILLGPDGYSAFIDRKTGTCSFDSPEFLRWLRFLESLPPGGLKVEEATPAAYGMRADTLEYYHTGRVMLNKEEFALVDSSVESMESVFGTKDWTILGYPADGHNGSYVSCEAALLMTTDCSDKELAWDVIRTLAAGFSPMIPAFRQAFKDQAEEVLEQREYMVLSLTHDADGWSRTSSRRQAPDGNFPTPADLDVPGWVSVPTAEDFARFEAFLDNDAGYPLTERLSPEISSIIKEEISAFLSGNGTAEDCAKKIQSRASIWMAEHN
ncbi:MAG: hypothetical protein E7576_15215 [Ruminococcaceae bacterium]|nr:hypothetical protein [Oscillospiraceae bacterium]